MNLNERSIRIVSFAIACLFLSNTRAIVVNSSNRGRECKQDTALSHQSTLSEGSSSYWEILRLQMGFILLLCPLNFNRSSNDRLHIAQD